MKTAIRFALLAVISVTLLGATGCKTEDELSSRPWATPKSWESGLPAAITEGR